MEAVSGHKGVCSFRVHVTGHEAHSSLTHLGVSANMVAVRLMASLHKLAGRLERHANSASPFRPKGATLTIGVINGGTALNILARSCTFGFDLRTPPGGDPLGVLAPFFAEAEALDAKLKARFPDAGVTVERRSLVPPLAPAPDGAAEAFARRLAGDNGPARVVSYAAEAGQFQQAGYLGGHLRSRLDRPGAPAGRIRRGGSDRARRGLHGAPVRGLGRAAPEAGPAPSARRRARQRRHRPAAPWRRRRGPHRPNCRWRRARCARSGRGRSA